MEYLDIIQKLSELKFIGKGEAFVESKFLTPLLECLGYENHNDYEVHRHGDSDINFKLSYPPVENGAVKVKHYNPDFIPTIRKQMFWVIEAKSPKTVSHPFDYKYITQGLQYCIHPEIQAKYLVLSNGENTCIYDPQSAIFFNEDIYSPILEFSNNEIVDKWKDIYNLLGVENLRIGIEKSLKKYYEKLCLSSLDTEYPNYLEKLIVKEKLELSRKIRKNVGKLYVEKRNQEYEKQTQYLIDADIIELEIGMEYPLGRGSNNASIFYVEKLLLTKNELEVFECLIEKYDKYSYFQKEHCFVAVCHLYQLSKNEDLQEKIRNFVESNAYQKLSLLNHAESILIRMVRKINVIYKYPALREKISQQLKDLPEIVRFVDKPIAQNYTYQDELILHDKYFRILSLMKSLELKAVIFALSNTEQLLEKNYKEAKKHQPRDEIEIGGGFECYGEGDTIWSLKNIAFNYKVMKK